MVTATPSSSAVRTEVCVARRTVSRSPRPMALAITTLTPSEMPTNRLTNRPIIALLVPTAATATLRSSPVKLPTTATSEALNSCESTAVAATGSANCGRRFQIGPCSISISFFLLTVSMAIPFAAACRTLLYRIRRRLASGIFAQTLHFRRFFNRSCAARRRSASKSDRLPKNPRKAEKLCYTHNRTRGECDEIQSHH